MNGPDPVINSQVVIQLLLIAGGVVTTWLTLKYKNLKRKSTPKDRIEFIFDGYESLIKELQGDLNLARKMNERQHEMIEGMQTKINTLRDDLHEERTKNKSLTQQLSKATGAA